MPVSKKRKRKNRRFKDGGHWEITEKGIICYLVNCYMQDNPDRKLTYKKAKLELIKKGELQF